MATTAFDYIAVVVTTSRQRRVREWAAVNQHDSVTATLIALLDINGPMTTRDLCDACALPHSKRVWGLLKNHLNSGRVTFLKDINLWELNRDYVGDDIRQAVKLLESNGWRCTAPIE